MDDGQQQNNLGVQGGNPGAGEAPFGAVDYNGAVFDTSQTAGVDPVTQPVQSASVSSFDSSTAPAEAPAAMTPIDQEMSRKMDELLGNAVNESTAQPTPGVNPFLTNNQPVQPVTQPMAAPQPTYAPQANVVSQPVQPNVAQQPVAPQKKGSSKVLIIILIAILVIGGVVLALMMSGVFNGDKKGGKTGNNGGGETVAETTDENVVVSGDKKRFGIADTGFVTVPSSWVRLNDVASNEQGFGDEAGNNVVKITSYAVAGSTTADVVAQMEYNAAATNDNSARMVEQDIEGRATKVISASNEEKTSWNKVFVFEQEGRIYVISVTAVSEDSELFESVPASWSLKLDF